MKKLIRQFLFAAALLCVSCFAGCNNDDPKPQYEAPTIAITQVVPTASSVAFTLTPTHAVRYTYAVALKDAAGTPVEVQGSEAVTRTVDGLEADREYTITAVAYGQDGMQSEAATYDFVTNAHAQIVISEVTTTYKGASFTLTPTNATGCAYRCVSVPDPYRTTRSDQEWIHVTGGEPTDVELTGLTASTVYRIEAYASNAEGNGPIVEREFITEPMPEPLTVHVTATSRVIRMQFEMYEDLTSGYYFYLHDTSYADDPVTSVETFLTDLRDAPDWYLLKTASDEELQTGCTAGTEYKLFTVYTDPDGQLVEESAKEISVTTKQFDALRTSQSTVAIGTLTPGYITLDAELIPTDDCVLALVECVKKSVVENLGTITAYVNMNLSNFKPVLSSSFVDTYQVQHLEPEQEYYLFTVGIDGNGDYGMLKYKEFSSTVVDYLQDVRAGVEVVKEGYLDVRLNVTYDNCHSVRYLCLSENQFVEWYGAEEQNVWQELYSSTSQELLEGEVTIEYLEYNSPYMIFALPVTEDGAFGQPSVTEFHTLKYAATGSAELSVTLNGIDRSGPFPQANLTITPGNGCTKFIYKDLDNETYDNNSARIGDYIFRMGNYVTVDPASEIQVEVSLWGSDYYLLAVACDADGNWSPVTISEMLVYDPEGGGGGGDPEPAGDPDEVDPNQISATAVTVSFRSYLYDQSSWNPEWSDWDNSVYRADISLEAGYTAWYHFVDASGYDWVANNEVGEGKTYATLALWIKEFGRQLTASGPIAARGDYGTDYIMLVLPETTDGKHASARVYKSPTYRWSDLTDEATDPGISGGDTGGGIDPRRRRR